VRQQQESMNGAEMESMNMAAQNAFTVCANHMVSQNQQMEQMQQQNQQILQQNQQMLQQMQQMQQQIQHQNHQAGGHGGGAQQQQAQAQQPQQAQAQAQQQLGQIPYIPAFPNELPASFKTLLTQHVSYDLLRQHTAVKRHWPPSLQSAFSKRMYLYNKIAAKASRYHVGGPVVRLRVAAEELDRQRDGATLPTYMVHLKRNDPAVRNRAPRNPRI
jgi:hypothetical protein